MKNIFCFLTLFIFLLYPFFVFSQESKRTSKFDIGIEAGPQFTNINETNSNYQTNSKTGFTAGIFGDYQLLKSLKLRFGTYFDERKYEKNSNIPFVAEINADSTGYVGTNSYYLLQVDHSLNYLTFPLSIVYENGSPKFQVLIQFGVYYSRLFSTSQKGESDLYIDAKDAPYFQNPNYTEGHHITTYSGNIEDQYNKNDFGINLFIGGNAMVGENLSIFVAPGLAYGFTNIYSTSEIRAQWKSMIRINAGLIYYLKK